jgi:hypothetical protein
VRQGLACVKANGGGAGFPKIIWTDKPKRGMTMMTNNLSVYIITFHHHLVFVPISLVMARSVRRPYQRVRLVL